jgi:hypothetical protein
MPAVARKQPFRLTSPTIREHPLHKQIADVLAREIAPAGRVSAHGVMWFSIDHADFAGVAATRIGRGVIAGLPDLFILWLGEVYLIEIKADDGIASAAQRSIIAGAIYSGCRVAVARDARDVLVIVDAWRIPRAGRTHL